MTSRNPGKQSSPPERQRESRGASEARFRAVWEASADAMALSDAEGTVLDVNTAYLELYGYTYDEVVGRNFAVIFPEDFRVEANRQYLEAFSAREGPPTFETEIVRKDGSRRVVESRADFIEEEGARVAMLSSIRDITGRIKVEEALRESEERFRQIFDNAPIGMALVGLDFKPIMANQALCTFLGYDQVEIARMTPNDLTYPDDLELDRQLAERLLSGEIPNYKIEKRYVTKAGGVVWAQLSAALLRDTEGNILYAITMLEDITKRKEADEESVRAFTREQAARAIAEKAVLAQEELLSLVSHDLRTPIAVVKAATQLLQRRIERGHPPDPEQLAKILSQLGTAADRMESFIRDLSTPQRMQPGQLLRIRPEMVDLVALARRVADMHQQQTEHHELRVEADPPQLLGYWDPARLEQVLDNLISNAVKYSPAGGLVTIEIGTREGEMGSSEQAQPRLAVVTVKDEGMGIPADDLPHIFEWYRRAANVRDVINGSGIGLAGARQIVEQHGGSISAESKEGAGATFTVLLPVGPRFAT